LPETIALDASIAVKWFKKGEEGETRAVTALSILANQGLLKSLEYRS
jgi:hypothetical protein